MQIQSSNPKVDLPFTRSVTTETHVTLPWSNSDHLDFPALLARFAPVGLGVSLLFPDEKHNRFKPLLRQVDKITR